jgi:hypothetical protein
MRTMEPEVFPPADDEPERPSRHRLWLVLGAVGFLAMAGFWLAIFTGTFEWSNPDTVHDATWVHDAGAVCAPAAATINDLPRAQSAHSATQRASTIDTGTDALDKMVAGLDRLHPAGASNQTMVSEWLADWHVYLGDRRAYAANLRVNKDAKPLVSERHGGWVTDAIDELANGNNIPQCATPGDM